LLAVAGVVGLAALGVAPFIAASTRVYDELVGAGPGLGGRLVSIERLLVRLITHPALEVGPRTGALALGAAVVLLASSRPTTGVGRGIAVALAAGLAAVTLARLLADRFDAALPQYNAWMQPGFCLLLSSGLAARPGAVRVAAVSAAGLLVLVFACGAYQLAAHGDYFAHGPHRKVAALIRGLRADGVALVHDGGSSRVDFLYRPLRYEFGRGLPHFEYAGACEGRAAVTPYNPPRPVVCPAESLPYRFLLVVRTRRTSAAEAADQIRHGDRPLGDGPVARELQRSPGWRFVRRAVFVASDTAEVSVFERCPQALPPTLRPAPPGRAVGPAAVTAATAEAPGEAHSAGDGRGGPPAAGSEIDAIGSP
jgi:hypothetical protein